MIQKFFKWMKSPKDLPGLAVRMFIALLLTVVWAFLLAFQLALIAAITMCRL